LISTVVMFQAQNREINNASKVAVSFKTVLTNRLTRPVSQHNKTTTKTKTDFFWYETGLVLRPTVSDHITAFMNF